MPDWILAPVCVIVLVGFIGYAFRQGMKVKPDRSNSDVGPGVTGSSDDGASHGGDGHSF